MPPESHIVRGGIALPCSSPRGQQHKFLKLLFRIDPEADSGFGFEGIFLKPGATVTHAELRPNPDFPEIPVCLEMMQGKAQGIPGHRRSVSIYILWRYERGAWRELARAESESWHWAIEIRPLALRALQEARGTALAVIVPDVPAIATRIAAALDCELRYLEPADRKKVVGVLHDEIAARLCG